jgi:hypothetical protein
VTFFGTKSSYPEYILDVGGQSSNAGAAVHVLSSGKKIWNADAIVCFSRKYPLAGYPAKAYLDFSSF